MKKLDIKKTARTISNALESALRADDTVSRNVMDFIKLESVLLAEAGKKLTFTASLAMANQIMINALETHKIEFKDLSKLHESMVDQKGRLFKCRRGLLNSFRTHLKPFGLVLIQKDSAQMNPNGCNKPFWSGSFKISAVFKTEKKAPQTPSIDNGDPAPTTVPMTEAVHAIAGSNKQTQIEALKALASELKLSNRDILTAFFGTVNAAKMEAAIATPQIKAATKLPIKKVANS